MELIKSFFGLINSFVLNIIYEKIIAEDLFSFDLNKKIIIIKNDKNLSIKFNDKSNKEDKQVNNKLITSNTLKKKKKKNKKNKLVITSNINKANDKNSEKESFDIYNYKDSKKYKRKESPFDKSINDKIDITQIENNSIIDTFNSTDMLLSLCACFQRKRGNLYKILFNEAMNVIKEKLDIFNIFRNLCLIENSKNVLNNNIATIKMSEECLNLLSDMKL